MAKQKSNKKKTTRKRTYKKKSSGLSTVKLFYLMVVIVLISTAALFYLRSAFIKHDDVDKMSVELNKKIAEIDSSIKEYLFDQGISSEEMDFTATDKSERGVRWKFKEGRARVKSTEFNNISNELEKISKLSDITLNIKESPDHLKAQVFAYGYFTHRLEFLPLSKKRPAEKAVKNENIKKLIKAPEKTDTEVHQNQKDGKDRPRIVIIVDDVGQKKDVIDKLVKIDFPLNFAVLPYLPYSEYAARAAYDNGKEVLLHLPMEPKYSSGYTAQDAGAGALLVGHSKDQIESQLESNLNSVPYIKGVNNHMGSKFTENEELMEIVLREIKERKLYFVDSLTSNSSSGKNLSAKLGIKFAERDVFLDDSKKGKQYVKDQLDNLVRIAERNGVAVGICHTYPQSIEALYEYLPEINRRVEISLVTSIFD